MVNAGSSSLKLRLLGDGNRPLAQQDLPAAHGRFEAAALTSALAAMGDADAVGHRVVHGGTVFTGSVRVDPGVEARLRALIDLAPLHLPANLAAMDAVARVRPDLPAIACFDTAFHVGLPAEAATYALPLEWRERYGLRRFGFHGLSHAYAARRAATLLGRDPGALRTVTCHLGSGASLAAVQGGRSVDTTMGFTPLEGLVMATRSGSVDPGLLLWLEEHAGLRPHDLATALDERSGLLALAGTADMREALRASAAGEPRAQLALGVYVHRLRGSVAAMAAALGGLVALVFTGGVGEHAPEVRTLTAAGLGFLGVALDEEANRAAAQDADISAPGAAVRTLVVAAREDVEIAGEVRRVLAAGG